MIFASRVLFRLLIICFFALTALFSSVSLAKPILTVYTYDSFISEWGPGLQLKSAFEKKCNCEVKWIAVSEGAALLAKLKIEGPKSKADVIVGVDDTLWFSAEKDGLFLEHNLTVKESQIPADIKLSPFFLPFDFSFYAIMFDSEAKDKTGKPYVPPKSFEELLTSHLYDNALIVQDPRTSAPGLGLLLWIQAQFGNQSAQKLKLLKKKILTVGKGWSQSYGLFTKGEAPFVFSYLTSEAYHKSVENTSRYQALHFEEGHYVTVEGAGILKSSKNHQLSKDFLNYLLSSEAQALIASKNWMLPAVKITADIPKELLQIRRPSKSFHIQSNHVHNSRTKWINEWLKTFEK